MREMFKSGETMHLHPASEEETEKEDGHTGGRVGEGDAGDETGVAAEGSGQSLEQSKPISAGAGTWEAAGTVV